MNRFLLILVFFILADVVADNSILRVFAVQPPILALILSMGMLFLQIVAAPIQAGFSDFYCRKKSLIFSLGFSLISIVLLFFTNSTGILSAILFILIVVIKGALGNTVPLTWAAMADTQQKKLRFSLALSTGAYAIGYMVLAITNMHPKASAWFFSDTIPASLFVLSILLCVVFFRDVRDAKTQEAYRKRKGKYLGLARSEFTALWKDLSRTSTRWGLLAYLLWATSQYSVLILITDFETQYVTTILWMMCGYLAGVVFLGFCQNIRDETIIRLGFGLIAGSLVAFFIAKPFVETIQLSFTVAYFFYTMGNAFLSATILTLFSKERHAHEQGKGFGLIVSADSAGFLLATITGIVYTIFQLKLFHMVMFSAVIFAVSWIPYIKYEKARKDSSGKRPLIF